MAQEINSSDFTIVEVGAINAVSELSKGEAVVSRRERLLLERSISQMRQMGMGQIGLPDSSPSTAECLI
jgi:hypothetical protein